MNRAHVDGGRARLAALGALALLGACSFGGSGRPQAQVAGRGGAADGTGATIEETADTRDTAGATDAAGTRQAGSCGIVRDGVRVVTDVFGEVEVPLQPQRVVVLDTGELDAAAAVGVHPIGVVEVGNHLDVPPHLAAIAEGAEDVGTIATPNLEAIARLQPDLILGNRVRDEEILDELRVIAPTVIGDEIGPQWRRNAELYTTAMGRCDEAAAAFAAYDEAVEALRAALGDRAAEIEVSVVRALFDRVRIYGNDSYIGAILADVGLGRPPAQDRDVLMEEVGIEQIADMDGDVVFLTRWGPIQPALDQIAASPIWSSLRAVQSGEIHEVDDSTWMLALGVYGAASVVADLHAALVEPAGTPGSTAPGSTAPGSTAPGSTR